MGFTLTKYEVKRLGSLFAEALLRNPDAAPAELPDLSTSKDWKRALPHERKQATSDIAQKARAILLESGYSKEIVEGKTKQFIDVEIVWS